VIALNIAKIDPPTPLPLPSLTYNDYLSLHINLFVGVLLGGAGEETRKRSYIDH
jgi:hypothetical protein